MPKSKKLGKNSTVLIATLPTKEGSTEIITPEKLGKTPYTFIIPFSIGSAFSSSVPCIKELLRLVHVFQQYNPAIFMQYVAADTLQLYTRLMISDVTDADNAANECRTLSQRWESNVFKPAIDEILTNEPLPSDFCSGLEAVEKKEKHNEFVPSKKGIPISHWDDYVGDHSLYKDIISATKAEIATFYENNTNNFSVLVDAAADKFSQHRKNLYDEKQTKYPNLPKFNTIAAREYSKKYILEECAVIRAWPRIYTGRGPLCMLYPVSFATSDVEYNGTGQSIIECMQIAAPTITILDLKVVDKHLKNTKQRVLTDVAKEEPDTFNGKTAASSQVLALLAHNEQQLRKQFEQQMQELEKRFQQQIQRLQTEIEHLRLGLVIMSPTPALLEASWPFVEANSKPIFSIEGKNGFFSGNATIDKLELKQPELPGSKRLVAFYS